MLFRKTHIKNPKKIAFQPNQEQESTFCETKIEEEARNITRIYARIE